MWVLTCHMFMGHLIKIFLRYLDLITKLQGFVFLLIFLQMHKLFTPFHVDCSFSLKKKKEI